MITLTEHQAGREDELIELIRQGHKRIILKGSAGTGKTTLSNHFITRIKAELYKYGAVYITAPTHKAVSVLKGKIDKKEYMEFQTIHSALQLKRNINFKTGETTFVQGKINPKFPPFKNGMLVIVDEASMLSSQLIYYLNAQAYRGLVMIFLGDNKQLNPPGEQHSPIFAREINYGSETIKLDYPVVELTEIVRQGQGSPIIDLSYNISNIYKRRDNTVTLKRIIKEPIIREQGIQIGEDFNLQTLMNIAEELEDDVDVNIDMMATPDEIEYTEREEEYISGYVHTKDREKIIQRLADVNGTDELKYLAYHNADVDQMNADVRKHRYGTPRKIEPDETLVFKGPFAEYFTNQEIKVETLEIKTITLTIPNENSKLFHENGAIALDRMPMADSKGNLVFDDNGNKIYPFETVDLQAYIINDKVPVLHEDSEKTFDIIADKIKRDCKSMFLPWLAYYYFLEQVAEVTYNHAITVHKSQGSTYKTAIIHVKNLSANRMAAEKQRLFYTAITRASDLVVLYNA